MKKFEEETQISTKNLTHENIVIEVKEIHVPIKKIVSKKKITFRIDGLQI